MRRDRQPDHPAALPEPDGQVMQAARPLSMAEYHRLDVSLEEAGPFDTMTAAELDGFLTAIFLPSLGELSLRERHLTRIFGHVDADQRTPDPELRQRVIARAQQIRHMIGEGDATIFMPDRLEPRRVIAEWVSGFVTGIRAEIRDWTPLLLSANAKLLFPILRHAHGFHRFATVTQAHQQIDDAITQITLFQLMPEAGGPVSHAATIFQLNTLISQAEAAHAPPVPMVLPTAQTGLVARARGHVARHATLYSSSLAVGLLAGALVLWTGDQDPATPTEIAAVPAPTEQQLAALATRDAQISALEAANSDSQRARDQLAARIEELEAQLRDAGSTTAETSALQSALSTRDAQLAALKIDQQDLLEQVRSREARIAESERTTRYLTSENARLSDENNELNGVVSALRKERDAALRSVQQSEDALAALQSETGVQLGSLAGQTDALSTQIAELTEARQVAQEKAKAAEAELAALKIDQKDLLEQIRSRETRIAESARTATDLADEKTRLSDEISTLNEVVSTLRDERDDAIRSVDQSQDALAALQSETEVQIASLTGQADALSEQITELTEARQVAEDRAEAAEAELAALTIDRTDLIGQVRSSEARIDESVRTATDLANENTRLVGEISALNSVVATLRDERDSAIQSVKQGQNALAALQSETETQLGSLAGQSTALSEQIRELTEARQVAEEKAKSATAELAKLQTQHAAEIAEARSREQQLSEGLAERDAVLAELVAERNASRAELLDLRQDFSGRAQMFEQEIASLTARKDELTELLAQANAENDALLVKANIPAARPALAAPPVVSVTTAPSAETVETSRRRDLATQIQSELAERYSLGTASERDAWVDAVAAGASIQQAFEDAFGDPHRLIALRLCRDFSELCGA
ncbi:hypothetical protein [Palleronia caenipelagi]|uniref:Uncharacterized protein n=1 Tax=Palleronia caenipelagi TaxID=2489174 RepID=A0A547Q6K2_9RHOB|nr:hypothetical protein [Palleronia caenipelagi]TRD22017.1 hypothetical protein FEV53_06485 [Palleronia caenipelagi]